jgi:hypothetical protein
MKYHAGLTIEKLAFLAMFVLYIDVDLIEFSSVNGDVLWRVEN